MDEEILGKLEKLPVAIDMQPQFVQEVYEEVLAGLGEKRIKGLHPLKSLLDRGLIVAGGSDAPIEVPNPLYGIYAPSQEETLERRMTVSMHRRKFHVFKQYDFIRLVLLK